MTDTSNGRSLKADDETKGLVRPFPGVARAFLSRTTE